MSKHKWNFRKTISLNKKYCYKCKKIKELIFFSKDKTTKDKYRNLCKECDKKKVGHNSLKKKYGISFKEYTDMSTKQNNVCFICKTKKGKYLLSVDHNHKNNKIRGLLCNSCNSGLGMFQDDTKLLQNAIDYLKLN